tara:strand:- start:63 stop:614 length:552 start_codon:yes stop_codon:yes gene_type:complete
MIKLITSLNLIILLISCGSKINHEPKEVEYSNILLNEHNVDTSLIAFLPYELSKNKIFKDARQASLSKFELNEIEILLIECIEKYNLEQKGKFEKFDRRVIEEYNIDIDRSTIDLKKYKRQYISVVNSYGQKEVWINCFCIPAIEYWKESIVNIDDGGNCFFNLKVNLSKGEFYDFNVNGPRI